MPQSPHLLDGNDNTVSTLKCEFGEKSVGLIDSSAEEDVQERPIGEEEQRWTDEGGEPFLCHLAPHSALTVHARSWSHICHSQVGMQVSLETADFL